MHLSFPWKGSEYHVALEQLQVQITHLQYVIYVKMLEM